MGTAKSAADALMLFDPDITGAVNALLDGREASAIPLSDKFSVLNRVARSFSLPVASTAAGVTKYDVLVAFAFYHLGMGSYPQCEDLLTEVFPQLQKWFRFE
jgi:hypothetical protein